jgi:hypothetical protein
MRPLLPVLVFLLAACGGTSSPATGDGGPTVMNVGAACVPSPEQNAAFTGGSAQEVNVDSFSSASGAAVCLSYHFQGRVSCPYGQDMSGHAPAGAMPCKTTGGAAVTGAVAAQCLDRRASKVVFYSCRCANASGKTSDGDTYCGCPSGMACTQLISPTGMPNDHLSGAYCTASGTAYDSASACSARCDEALANCN